MIFNGKMVWWKVVKYQIQNTLPLEKNIQNQKNHQLYGRRTTTNTSQLTWGKCSRNRLAACWWPWRPSFLPGSPLQYCWHLWGVWGICSAPQTPGPPWQRPSRYLELSNFRKSSPGSCAVIFCSLPWVSRYRVGSDFGSVFNYVGRWHFRWACRTPAARPCCGRRGKSEWPLPARSALARNQLRRSNEEIS